MNTTGGAGRGGASGATGDGRDRPAGHPRANRHDGSDRLDHSEPVDPSGGHDRRDRLAANLAAVRRRISAACAAAGRDPGEITLIAVTKTFPASDLRLLAELGVSDIGENRDQEAAPKATETAGLPLTWHFVGQLQTNKCGSVARYADFVHSVDRARLVSALDRAAARAGRRLRCMAQVSLEAVPDAVQARAVRPDTAAGRAGIAPADAAALAARIVATENLELAGVMAIAPLGADPRPAYAALAEVAAEVRAKFPTATAISAGMSADLEAAIASGATHVRIGTALLGGRPPIVG